MNQSNVTVLKKARSMCLLYGIVCLTVGFIFFADLNEFGLAMVMATVAILGFWRISYKIKKVLDTEAGK